MTKKVFLFTVILSLILTACSTKEKELENMQTLKNIKWKALVLNNIKVQNNLRDATIQFDEDERAFGSLGCNNFFSNYTKDGEKLILKQVGSTMMMCPDMTTERNFLAVIENVKSYSLEANILKFYDKNKKEIAEFIKE